MLKYVVGEKAESFDRENELYREVLKFDTETTAGRGLDFSSLCQRSSL
jgi:hypothetical protein